MSDRGNEPGSTRHLLLIIRWGFWKGQIYICQFWLRWASCLIVDSSYHNLSISI